MIRLSSRCAAIKYICVAVQCCVCHVQCIMCILLHENSQSSFITLTSAIIMRIDTLVILSVQLYNLCPCMQDPCTLFQACIREKLLVLSSSSSSAYTCRLRRHHHDEKCTRRARNEGGKNFRICMVSFSLRLPSSADAGSFWIYILCSC